MFFMSSSNNEKIVKTIYCKKTYNHDKLDNVVVDDNMISDDEFFDDFFSE